MRLTVHRPVSGLFLVYNVPALRAATKFRDA